MFRNTRCHLSANLVSFSFWIITDISFFFTVKYTCVFVFRCIRVHFWVVQKVILATLISWDLFSSLGESLAVELRCLSVSWYFEHDDIMIGQTSACWSPTDLAIAADSTSAFTSVGPYGVDWQCIIYALGLRMTSCDYSGACIGHTRSRLLQCAEFADSVVTGRLWRSS